MSMILNFYREDDVEFLLTLAHGMSLLEDDYLGGNGSRGHGRVALRNLTLTVKGGYDTPGEQQVGYKDVPEFLANVDSLRDGILDMLFGG